MPYLIDGHNLIARLPDISLADPDDEAKLVLRLRGFAARSKKQCIVVFDNGLPGGQSPLSTHSVKVIFAPAYQTTADRILQERIRHTPDSKNWTVVSSDNEVLDSARQHGMKAMTSAEFAAKIQLPAKTPPDRSEAVHVVVTEKEVADWLERFGAAPDIDPPETPPVSRPKNGKNGHQPDPEPKPSSAPKKPAARPLSTAGKFDDDVYISDNDIDSWMRLFNSAPPLKPVTPPKKNGAHPTKNGVRPRIPGKGEHDTPPEPPRPAAARKPDTSTIPGKFDGDPISPEDIAEWLRLFGDGDE